MSGPLEQSAASSKTFIGIHFIGCNTYVRLYPNAGRTHFEGRCTKCGKTMKLRIGNEGHNDRFFQAPCMVNRNDAYY